MSLKTIFLALTLLIGIAGDTLAAEPGTQPATAWYRTQPMGDTWVHQKQITPISAELALSVFDDSEDRLTGDWLAHLPEPPSPAEQIDTLDNPHSTLRLVREEQPLKLHIVGFDNERVRVIVGRHVANLLWHWYHDVQADLMVERSEKIDHLLGLPAFTPPFTRTVQGIGHGASREQIHETLGPPDAFQFTQAVGFSWDYYFDEGVTIHYQNAVFQILDEVPEEIRNRESENPHVVYREKP